MISFWRQPPGKNMERLLLRYGRYIKRSLFYIIATLIAIFFLLPLVYAVSSSLKPLKDVFSFPMRWIPLEMHLENFIEPFIKGNFTRYFLNSIFIAVVVTLSSVLFCSLAGYSLTKFRYPGREVVFILILAIVLRWTPPLRSQSVHRQMAPALMTAIRST